jgi:hypothetical protein
VFEKAVGKLASAPLFCFIKGAAGVRDYAAELFDHWIDFFIGGVWPYDE